MEHNALLSALTSLPERLARFDGRASSYCGHLSTSKGVTLLMQRGSLFLYHSVIHKLIHQPDAVTEEDLAKMMSNFR